MTEWLTIIGLGEDGIAEIGDSARQAILNAKTVVGGARHLDLIPENPSQHRVIWPTPFSDGIAMVLAQRGSPVCILASGDPMNYGVGATLARHVPPSEMRVLAAPSAFTLAAARLGWAVQDCVTLTIHGRPLELVHPHLHPGAKLLILSENGHSPQLLADLLTQRQFGPSPMTVLEHMGGGKERIIRAKAQDWSETICADLNVVAVDCIGTGGLSTLAGLPDEAFLHDGQLTKRDVRAVTLARLAPQPGQVLWDVGAGCGSIGIEWMRSHPTCRAIAIEANESRQNLIVQNAKTLGVPGLKLVSGKAPAALDGLPPPDAIFIGGGLTVAQVPQICWDALPPGGRLAANAVTLESAALLTQLQHRWGGSLTQIQISHAEAIGRFQALRANLPVLVWVAVKPPL